MSSIENRPVGQSPQRPLSTPQQPPPLIGPAEPPAPPPDEPPSTAHRESTNTVDSTLGRSGSVQTNVIIDEHGAHLAHQTDPKSGISFPDKVPVMKATTATTAEPPVMKAFNPSDAKPFDLSKVNPQELTQKYQEALKSYFESDQLSDYSDIKQYGRSLKLLHKLEHDDAVTKDPQAQQLLKMNQRFIEDKLQSLSKSESVKRRLDEHKSDFLSEKLGIDYYSRALSTQAQMLSDDYLNTVEALPQEQQDKKIEHDINALKTIDSELGQQTALALNFKRAPQSMMPENPDARTKWIAQHIFNQAKKPDDSPSLVQAGAKSIEALKLDKVDSALEKGLKTMAHFYPDQDKKELFKALQELGDDLPSKNVAEAWNKRIKDLEQKYQGTPLESTKNLVESGLSEQRKMKAFLSGVAYAGMVADIHEKGWAGHLTDGIENPDPNNWRHFFQTSDKALDAINTGASTLKDSASYLGKNLGYRPDQMHGLENLKIFEAADKLGKAAGVIKGTYGAYQEFYNEDSLGMMAKGTGAIASGVGLMATGPVAAAAGSVALASSAVDYVAGETELTGQIRAELRLLGTTEAQENTVKKYAADSWSPANLDAAITQLNQQGKPQDKAHIVNHLMDQHTDPWQEEAIADIISNTTDEQLPELLSYLDMGIVASEMENKGAYHKIDQRLQARMSTLSESKAKLENDLLVLQQNLDQLSPEETEAYGADLNNQINDTKRLLSQLDTASDAFNQQYKAFSSEMEREKQATEETELKSKLVSVLNSGLTMTPQGRLEIQKLLAEASPESKQNLVSETASSRLRLTPQQQSQLKRILGNTEYQALLNLQ